MDDIDKAQYTLEGLCYECKEPLLKHDGLCARHPHRELIDRIFTLHYFVDDIQVRAVKAINEADLSLEEMQQIIANSTKQ